MMKWTETTLKYKHKYMKTMKEFLKKIKIKERKKTNEQNI